MKTHKRGARCMKGNTAQRLERAKNRIELFIYVGIGLALLILLGAAQ